MPQNAVPVVNGVATKASGEESLTVTTDGELTYSITCSSGSSSASADVVVTAKPINQTGRYRQEDGKDIFLDANRKPFQMPLMPRCNREI